MATRRTYLTTLAISVASTTGCLGLFENDEETSAGASDTVTKGGEGPPDGYEAPEDSPHNDSSEDPIKSGNHSKDEGSESDKDDRKAAPDDEETEIDRDQYDDSHEETDVTEVDDSDLETSYYTAITDSGTVEALGIVENTSDTTISAVDLELIAYGTDGDHLGSHLETIRELEAGQNRRFSIQISPERLDGDPERAELSVSAYTNRKKITQKI